jgi:FtsZ-interacting cell division protein ZipA
MEISLSNPIVLIVGGIALLALIFYWNKRNTNKQRQRSKRSFRKRYQEKKKGLENGES